MFKSMCNNKKNKLQIKSKCMLKQRSLSVRLMIITPCTEIQSANALSKPNNNSQGKSEQRGLNNIILQSVLRESSRSCFSEQEIIFREKHDQKCSAWEGNYNISSCLINVFVICKSSALSPPHHKIHPSIELNYFFKGHFSDLNTNIEYNTL